MVALIERLSAEPVATAVGLAYCGRADDAVLHQLVDVLADEDDLHRTFTMSDQSQGSIAVDAYCHAIRSRPDAAAALGDLVEDKDLGWALEPTLRWHGLPTSALGLRSYTGESEAGPDRLITTLTTDRDRSFTTQAVAPDGHLVSHVSVPSWRPTGQRA